MEQLNALNNYIANEMPNAIPAIYLMAWIDDAQTRNTSFAKDRRELLETLHALKQSTPHPPAIYLRLTDSFW